MYILKNFFCRSELLSFIKKLRVSFIDLITIIDFCRMTKNTEFQMLIRLLKWSANVPIYTDL
jgi:hypothetical protein